VGWGCCIVAGGAAAGIDLGASAAVATGVRNSRWRGRNPAGRQQLLVVVGRQRDEGSGFSIDEQEVVVGRSSRCVVHATEARDCCQRGDQAALADFVGNELEMVPEWLGSSLEEAGDGGGGRRARRKGRPSSADRSEAN